MERGHPCPHRAKRDPSQPTHVEAEPRELRALRCSQSYLDVLGVQPALGRNFTAEEEETGGRDAVILTNDLWTRLLGAAQEVLWSTLTIDGSTHEVGGRAREIGVRRALGADTGDVVRLILGHSVGLAVAGISFGLAIVIAVRHAIAHFLYRVDVIDPFTIVSVAVLLLVVALLAGLVPARRAAAIDPLVVLRDN